LGLIGVTNPTEFWVIMVSVGILVAPIGVWINNQKNAASTIWPSNWIEPESAATKMCRRDEERKIFKILYKIIRS
jgi:hypothetical protein